MRSWILFGIFLGVFIFAFGIFAYRISESPAPSKETGTAAGAAISDIRITDTYKKGVHTIRGTATVPTACTRLSAAASVPDASSTLIRVDLSAQIDEGMCLAVPTAVPFTLTATASAGVPVEIYANGTLATTTP